MSPGHLVSDLQANIALAMVDAHTLRSAARCGQRLPERELVWERRMARAQVVERPFFAPERRRGHATSRLLSTSGHEINSHRCRCPARSDAHRKSSLMAQKTYGSLTADNVMDDLQGEILPCRPRVETTAADACGLRPEHGDIDRCIEMSDDAPHDGLLT